MIPEYFVSEEAQLNFFQNTPLPREILTCRLAHGYKVGSAEHEHELYQFLQQEKKKCDTCIAFINRGELVSVGVRNIWLYEEDGAEDKFPVDGKDIIHWYCADDIKQKYKLPYDKDNEEDTRPSLPSMEEILKQRLVVLGDVSRLPGFNVLSEEEKKNYLEWNSQQVTEEKLKSFVPLKGMICVITGVFSKSKEEVTQQIRDNGGDVKDSVTANVNCCVLGDDGETEYGQATGSKSKKYKEFKQKKKKCPTISENELKELLSDKTTTFEEKYAAQIATTNKRKSKGGGNQAKKVKK